MMLRKAIGLSAVLLAAGMITGCNQNQQKAAEQKNVQQEFERGGHHGLKKICADDIQKYCASADRKKRCLKENIDKLSDACKTAVQQHGGGHKHNKDKGNDNKSDDNDD